MFLEKLTAEFRWLKVRPETGQTLVEYGMIIALVAIAAIVGISLVASQVDSLWGGIVTKAGDAITNVLGG
jgi:Flp pilus assembly pilin Flp